MLSHWSTGTSGAKCGCADFCADVAVLNQFTMYFQTGFFCFWSSKYVYSWMKTMHALLNEKLKKKFKKARKFNFYKLLLWISLFFQMSVFDPLPSLIPMISSRKALAYVTKVIICSPLTEWCIISGHQAWPRKSSTDKISLFAVS